ncbi:hypothetical protein F442_16181 [Phytophthora nicotianae P10297]|uniref:Uncharacterized protein n=1 Tax=Phytophthora nicotianae P10297 TaxID=1317064 RepID=W2YM57_PHYNI|nr:hypothetical protein F442_16181 [Phytophthora nicotianae P10297]
MGNISSCYKTKQDSQQEPCTPAIDENQATKSEPSYKPQVEEEVDRPVVINKPKQASPTQDTVSVANTGQPKPLFTASSPLLSPANECN